VKRTALRSQASPHHPLPCRSRNGPTVGPRLSRPRPHRRRSGSGGVSLVEVLVAVVVGSALVVAITTLVMRSEAGRRGLTASNDSSQNAAFVALLLDRTLRSAGSGFSRSWRQAYGCRLLAARSGSQILPRNTAFPPPFADVPGTVRLAPVLVHAGLGAGGSDVLAVATGASGLGESPLAVRPGSVTSSQLRLTSTLGFRPKDLLLVLQDPTNCMVQQVADSFSTNPPTDTVLLGGSYASASVNSVNLSSLGVTSPAFVAPLGNLQGNTPALQLLGVSANATLVSYDLLRMDGSDTITPLADSVVDLRARYGVDSDGDGRIDNWVSPAAAPFDTATLLDGSSESLRNLASIQALRVGLVMRSAVPDREAVSPTNLVMFADLAVPLHHTRTLSSSERLLRHRTVEFTVPLRNVMLIPRT
jgi:type IV pilus assembly protein PilW